MKIGDRVRIVSNGHTYTSHKNMAHELKSSNWSRGYLPKNGSVGEVINIYREFILVEDDKGREFVIGSKGLEVLPPYSQLTDINREWKGLMDELA